MHHLCLCVIVSETSMSGHDVQVSAEEVTFYPGNKQQQTNKQLLTTAALLVEQNWQALSLVTAICNGKENMNTDNGLKAATDKDSIGRAAMSSRSLVSYGCL